MHYTRYILIPLLLIIGAASLQAQQGAAMSGYVVDAESQETLIGAIVTIRGTKLGAVTNKSGFFSIKNIPAGEQTIFVSYVGYERDSVQLQFSDGESKKQTFSLKPSSVLGEQVVVQGDRAAEKREITVSRVNIPVRQLNQLRIGGEADVFRSLQYLPGVLTSSQVSSGLFIRGGSPDQNLVLLDGSTVYNPSHLFGFFSTFNPDAIKDVDLIKGGFPAEYGGRLSAVLNLTQKDGNRKEVEGVGSLGLISSRLSLQGPVGDGSWFIGGRRTYLDLLLGLLPEDPESPLPSFNFYDANAKITQTLGDADRISLSGFISRDNLTLDGGGIDFEIGIGNKTGALRWTHTFGDDLFLQTVATASRYDNGFNGDNGGFNIGVENSITDFTLKSHLEASVSEDLTLKTGAEVTKYTFDYLQNFSGDENPAGGSTDGRQNGQFKLTVDDWVYSGFAQANYFLTDQISVQGGVHASYLDLSKITTIDPRFALRYQMNDDVAIKGAWGIFHQYLRLASLPDFSFFDTWLPTDSTVVPSKANHYILGIETKPFEGYDLNVDVYYKTLDNISELNQFATEANNVSEVFFSGEGKAYGLEVFLQRRAGDFTGWIGYALGYVTARFDSLNGGKEFRPKYDRRHDLKIVGQYKIDERWEVGASFTFQSGQSYTAASSRFRTRVPGETEGTDVVVPSQRNGLRLPPSHQLNINANYSSTLFGLPMRLLIDIFNVYSRRDIWFRYYDTSKKITEVTDVRLLPIIPTVSIEIKF